MTPARVLPLLLACAALIAPAAAATDLPAIGASEAHATSHEEFVLTASFVATYDAGTGRTTVTFTCAGTTLGFVDGLRCTVYYPGGSQVFEDDPLTPFAAYSGETSYRGDEDEVRVCATIRNPYAIHSTCATSAI